MMNDWSFEERFEEAKEEAIKMFPELEEEIKGMKLSDLIKKGEENK